MDKLRCFIAIDLPDNLKREMVHIQERLKLWPARVKWIEEKNFHLTIKFLGDVPVNLISQIEEILNGISYQHKSWEVVLSEIGAFPNNRFPKVIWSGIKDSRQGLIKLWEDTEEGLEKLGFEKERRRFSPHLTLGRIKEDQPPGGFREIIEDIKLDNLLFPINKIKLMKSQLSRTGPEYSCINSFYLQEH